MTEVNFTVNVYDNYIEITPDAVIADNEIYEIVLNDLKDISGASFSNQTIEIITKLTPSYVTDLDVRMLLGDINITDKILLYQIREASKFAQYISNQITDPVNFEVKQFIAYKAAENCLLAFYLESAANSSGKKGQLGDVSFENANKTTDISELLKYIKDETTFWLERARGYGLEGRTKPLLARPGKAANPAFTSIGLNFNRGV